MTSDNHHDICNGVTIYSLGIECGYRTWTNMTHFSDDLPIKTGFPLPERPMSFPHCHKPGFSFGYALPIEMIFLVRLYNVCKIVSNWDVSPTSSLNVGYKRNVTSPVGTNRHGKIFTENWGWKIGSSGWIHQAGHLDIFHPQMVSPPVFSFFFLHLVLGWCDWKRSACTTWKIRHVGWLIDWLKKQHRWFSHWKIGVLWTNRELSIAEQNLAWVKLLIFQNGHQYPLFLDSHDMVWITMITHVQYCIVGYIYTHIL